jgi:hypothetical protein
VPARRGRPWARPRTAGAACLLRGRARVRVRVRVSVRVRVMIRVMIRVGVFVQQAQLACVGARLGLGLV